MNRHSAPGPDGFGPGFYAAAWDTVKDKVMNLVQAFATGEVDLDRINRAYIVLLPKKTGAVKPGDFRPICLQNCPMKILAKMLTTRLQQEIAKLIDLDKTGFIKGRSISENFIYAMELVQCCHKRKLPALVLKLGFAKAFDSGQLTTHPRPQRLPFNLVFLDPTYLKHLQVCNSPEWVPWKMVHL